MTIFYCLTTICSKKSPLRSALLKSVRVDLAPTLLIFAIPVFLGQFEIEMLVLTALLMPI
jgi:hypothetical protein